MYLLLRDKWSIHSSELHPEPDIIRCLVYSNPFNYNKKAIQTDSFIYIIKAGSRLLSQAVPHQVPSAVSVLTVVFEMGTGVSPRRITTSNSPSRARTYNPPVNSRMLYHWAIEENSSAEGWTVQKPLARFLRSFAFIFSVLSKLHIKLNESDVLLRVSLVTSSQELLAILVQQLCCCWTSSSTY